VGNFKFYNHSPKVGTPEEYRYLITKNPTLVLKMYEMKEPNAELKLPTNEARKFLVKEVNRGEISPLSGVGITILSEGRLNVGVWGDDATYPIVLINNLYEYSNELKKIKRLSVNKAGRSCIWEDKIFWHERNCWERYLASERTNENKLNYLSDFLQEQ
jgi:hypothetical protein